MGKAPSTFASTFAPSTIPDYAPVFHLNRYQDPAYQQLLATWEATSGQL